MVQAPLVDEVTLYGRDRSPRSGVVLKGQDEDLTTVEARVTLACGRE